MFIVLEPKNGLEKGEKGKFLVPIAVDVADVDSFYIPIYDTYEEAVEAAPNTTILELPLTGEIDKLELDVVVPEENTDEPHLVLMPLDFSMEKLREDYPHLELQKQGEKSMTQETVKSTHRVEVVPIKLEKHPNADNLSIVRI